MNYNEIINQLFEGDCLKYLKQFPDNSIDMGEFLLLNINNIGK